MAILDGGDGPLGIEFEKIGVGQFDPSMAKQYDLYVANTVTTIPAALNTAPSSDKVIGWIHESRQEFLKYRLDEKQYGLQYLTRAIVPSKFMLQDYCDLMPTCELSQLRNLVTMENVDRRRAVYQNHFAVTGAWDPNKNQAGLLQLLAHTRLNIGINFIGAQKPKDITDSHHNFFGQVPIAEAKQLISSSAGLISTAHLETQNLSAIESILSMNPVLLSDNPAHRELRSLIPSVILFDVHDPSSFLSGFEAICSLKQNQALLEYSKNSAEKYFGRIAFTQAVQSLLS
jgi:hypothetical protein